MSSQCIDQLRALAHHQIASSMLHQLTLLIGRFDPNEPHGRPSNRLTDRGRVSGVVLVALDVSLDVLRWHSDLVAEPRQFACPMVRRGTGLYADKALTTTVSLPSMPWT